MSRLSSWVVPLMVLVGLPSLAWAQQRGDYYGPHMMWGGGWHSFFLGPLMMILFIVVAVAVVFFLVRRFGGIGHGGAPFAQVPSGQTPLEILKERFARGEIDQQEFEDRRRVLED